MSFVVAAGAAVFVMLTQDEGALTLQRARAQAVRFACKSGKAELRLLLVETTRKLGGAIPTNSHETKLE